MATMKDIARLAGVSYGTVSNVLNGSSKVSSAKILAVQKAAQELSYTVDLRAKFLREGRSDTFAVILPNIKDNPYNDFYVSFQHCAEKLGFKTDLYLSYNSFQREQELMERIRASQTCGVAALTTYSGDEDVYAQAGFSPEEVLYVGHRPNEACSFLGFDYRACGHALGKRAAAYRYPALVTDDVHLTSQREIIAGFLEETEKNPDCHVICVEKTGAELAPAMAMNLFSGFPVPDAVFSTSHGVAQTLRNTAQAFFDMPELPIFCVSPLFTLPEKNFEKYELNFRQLGSEAAQMLAEGAEGGKGVRQRTLPNDGFRTWMPRITPTQSGCDRLSLITLDSPTAHTMQNMARLYTKATGTRVDVNIFSYDAVHELLTSLNPSNTFDVIRLDATWLSWFAEKIYEPLEQIDPDITSLLDRFVEGIAPHYGQMDGHLYALPETPSSQMLFYRQDLFSNSVMQRLYKESCGRDLKPPETFQDYNRIARFFTRQMNPSSPVRYGSTLTLGNTGVAATEFLSRYFSLTDHLFDEQDRILLTSEEAVQALEMLAEVRQYASPRYSSWWRDTARQFAQGEVAMTVLFSNYASEMLDKESRIRTRIGTGMVPGGNPLLGGGAIGVCKYSRHKEEALNLIRWFCSEEVSAATTLLGSVSPCWKTYDNYQVIDTYPWLALSEKSFAASHVIRRPTHSSGSFDERRFLSILGVNVMQAIHGLVSPRQALENACAAYEGR